MTTAPQIETRSVAVATEQQATLQGNTMSLKAKAATITVDSVESYAAALAFVGSVKQLAKDLEADQKKLTAPLDELKKEIKGRYTPNLTMLEEVEKEVKGKMLTFQQEENRKAEAARAAEQKAREEQALKDAAEVERMKREQQEKIEAEAKAKADELKAKGDAEAAAKVEEQAKVEVAATEAAADKMVSQRFDATVTKAAVTTPVRAGGFSSGLQKRWTYEVVDITKVPAEMLEVKAGEVQKAMNAMVRENKTPTMAGIRFFQQEGLAIR